VDKYKPTKDENELIAKVIIVGEPTHARYEDGSMPVSKSETRRWPVAPYQRESRTVTFSPLFDIHHSKLL
jgi:hypothetical protein